MKSLFVDFEFPRGRGDQVKKSWKFQGVGGSHVNPSGTENPRGWGLKLEKTLRGGYGYFWEPHNAQILIKYVLPEEVRAKPPKALQSKGMPHTSTQFNLTNKIL